jgi:hypothetical protein
MDLLNIFIYIVIFSILFYVFSKLYNARKIETVQVTENMVGYINNQEFNNITSNSNLPSLNTLTSIEKKYAQLPLKEYCIKASYNSATTGKSINKNMIKYVLSRGCRFIDFEVFYSNINDNYKAVVAESSDPDFKVFDTDNHIDLEDCFTTIITNGFSNTSPNKTDPLFVHLRIKTKDTNCYAAVAKAVDSILKPKLFEGQVTKETKLSETMGKIILVIDKTIHRDYKEYAKCKASDVNCYDLANYLNLESGSQDFNLLGLMQIENQPPNYIQIKDDNISTNVVSTKVVLPLSKSNNNPNIQKIILTYGAQIIAYRYNVIDENLIDSEIFFNDSRGGIAPLAAALVYFRNIQREQKGL